MLTIAVQIIDDLIDVIEVVHSLQDEAERFCNVETDLQRVNAPQRDHCPKSATRRLGYCRHCPMPLALDDADNASDDLQEIVAIVRDLVDAAIGLLEKERQGGQLVTLDSAAKDMQAATRTDILNSSHLKFDAASALMSDVIEVMKYLLSNAEIECKNALSQSDAGKPPSEAQLLAIAESNGHLLLETPIEQDVAISSPCTHFANPENASYVLHEQTFTLSGGLESAQTPQLESPIDNIASERVLSPHDVTLATTCANVAHLEPTVASNHSDHGTVYASSSAIVIPGAQSTADNVEDDEATSVYGTPEEDSVLQIWDMSTARSISDFPANLVTRSASLTAVVQPLRAPTDDEDDDDAFIALDFQAEPALLPPSHNKSIVCSIPHLVMETTPAAMLRQEQEATFVAREREWSSKLARLQQTLFDKEQEVSDWEKHLQRVTTVVAEYDKTMRQLLSDSHEKLQTYTGETIEEVIQERDQALEDLENVESAFSELHVRYEQLKATTDDFRQNESELKRMENSLNVKLQASEECFSHLKTQAQEKLVLANEEIERLDNLRQVDILGLRVQLKRTEVLMENFEKEVDRKNKEIIELTSICEELIAKSSL